MSLLSLLLFLPNRGETKEAKDDDSSGSMSAAKGKNAVIEGKLK
jgi:hypothetical protein